MFAFIKGTLVEATATAAVLETAGIGYQIFLPVNVISKLPQIGQQLTLHTSFIIRECSQTLYGFFSRQDRDVFEGLLNVSGIGPKLSLSIVGHMSLPELQSAISRGDIRALTQIPGIGKKIAERLIIEMRDKINQFFASDPSAFAVVLPQDPKAQTINDAMSALIHLGYNQMTAQKAIKKSMQEFADDKTVELSTLITTALKHV